VETTAAKKKSYDGFTDDERSAMKEHAQEMKTAGRRGSTVEAAEMTAANEAQIGEIVKKAAS
jgi:hypothetical protein